MKSKDDMTNTQNFIATIRDMVANDDLSTAIKQLSSLLKDSPKLDEVILQSARYNNVMQQVRLGVVDYATANMTQNQIRYGILELLKEIEEQEVKEQLINEEIDNFTSKAQNSTTITGNNNITIQGVNGGNISINTGNSNPPTEKNVIKDSTITVGGNMHVGDVTTTNHNQNADKIYNIEHIDNANFS